MNPVVHFEMPAEDPKRAVAFYSRVFGWTAQQLGPEMGDYTIVMTAESDATGPLERNAINGGFFRKTPEAGAPNVVIAVDDIRAHMKTVEAAGGTILGGPDEIPGVGSYAVFRDPEGNRVAMLQPLR